MTVFVQTKTAPGARYPWRILLFDKLAKDDEYSKTIFANIMYAVIEKNKLAISVAEFYAMDWYEQDHFPFHEELFQFDYGHLEIDIHKNGKKYLTGFEFDPRYFIVDYLRFRYDKDFKPPRKVYSVSIDTGSNEMFCVDFLKAHSFVIDGMEKDLIFPQFCRRKGELVIQGFDVMHVFSVFRYLTQRFDFKKTMLIRQGDRAYDLKTECWHKIRLRGKKKKVFNEKKGNQMNQL